MLVSKEVKPHVGFLSSPGMGHITAFFELAKHIVTNHDITTDASAAQNQFFQSPDIPAGISIVNIPPADMSNTIDESTLILSRVCFTVQESLKPIRSILVEGGLVLSSIGLGEKRVYHAALNGNTSIPTVLHPKAD